MCFDPYNPLGYENVENYFAQEWEYMPDGGYCSNRYNKRLRQEALDVIIETIRKGDEKVEPFVPYLAMNYFDCYLSRNGGLLLKRPKKGEYIQAREVHDVEKVIENGLKGRMQSITPMCFIGYFLNACKVQHEALEVRQSITHIILETQSDIRFSCYKPSIIAGSAVIAFLSDRSPEYSQIYEEKVERLLGYIDKNKLKNCLVLMKETYDKKNLRADIGMRKLSVQGGENGLHVSIDYQLQWKVSDEIEEILKTLGAGTRVSIQLAKVYKRMMGEAEEIEIFLSEIENGDVEYAIEDLTGLLENLGRLSERMQEVIIKSNHYREDPQ
ncbi:unnamed protein product [Arabidopsis halleri]